MEREIGLKGEEIAELCRRHRVRRLALFGSAVGEGFDPERSDLDFLVEFKPLPPGTYADTLLWPARSFAAALRAARGVG